MTQPRHLGSWHGRWTLGEAAALAVLVGLWSVAQPPALSAAQQQPVFTARTDFVRLDVGAVDRNGRPVRDLTQADFVIKEDGQPQIIQTFATVDLPAGDPVSSAWLKDARADVVTNQALEAERLVVILMDNSSDDGTDLAATESAKEIGRSVVDALGPLDSGAVIHTLGGQGNQEFTHDRARLRAAVDRYRPAAGRSFEQFVALEVLRALVESLADVPDRRKAVIWVGSGIPIEIPVPGKPGASDYLLTLWTRALTAARVGNVNIFPVDPAGLKTIPPEPLWVRTSNRLEKQRDFLVAMAANTGGRAFVNSNEFQSKISQIFAETGSFYLLGYAPSRPVADGKYRRLEVKVNRPGVTVHTRAGYYAPSPPDARRAALPVPPPAVLALAGLMPVRDVPLALAALPFPQVGRPEATVAVSVGVPASPDSALDVRVRVFTFDGDPRQTVSVPVAPSTEPGQALARVELPPGRYQVRASAARTRGGLAGSVYADLDVPDFARAAVSLSGVAVSLLPTPPSVPPGALADVVPQVPATRRTFAPGDAAAAFVQVVQGGDKPPVAVALATRVVNDRNVAVVRDTQTLAPERFGLARTADVRYVLPLTTLAPGEYLLTFEATLGKATARRDVRFTVK
jgi:VWFA-related protein